MTALTTSPSFRIEEATLSPAEVEKACDLPQTLQRSWRKRGFLPSRSAGKWNRFQLSEAAEALLLMVASKLGIGPAETSARLGSESRTLIYFALLGSDGACEFFGSRQDVDQLILNFQNDDALAFRIAGTMDRNRFLVAAEGSELRRAADVSSLISSETAGWTAMIDLLVLGRRFAERLGRPLFTIHLDEVPTQPLVRKLSGSQTKLALVEK